MPYPGPLLRRCFSDCYSSLAGTYEVRRHELPLFKVSVARDYATEHPGSATNPRISESHAWKLRSFARKTELSTPALWAPLLG